VLLEASWEVFENTPFVIERYRAATIALDYYGDSLVNSVSDIAAMMSGFFIARRLPVWASVVLVVSLEIVAAETDRLERLVGDVLDLAKLQAHRFTVRHEEVDLERVLDHAYGAFTEEARRREIDYRLSGVDSAPVIVSDGDRVLQVITNLLSNAFRWTPDGGRIELQLASSNGTVSVDVLDTGPGVPPTQRRRIFEAFVSQDADGTGLGLPIARELAAALGGGLELQSESGAGSRFRLVLPRTPSL